MISARPFSPPAITAPRSPASAALNGSRVRERGPASRAPAAGRARRRTGYRAAARPRACRRCRRRRYARRAAGSPAAPRRVVRATKSRMPRFAAPSRQAGSGSPAAAAGAAVRARAAAASVRRPMAGMRCGMVAGSLRAGCQVPGKRGWVPPARGARRRHSGAGRALLAPAPCRCDRGFDLRLHRLHVEARALLHRREVDEGLARPWPTSCCTKTKRQNSWT